MSPDGDDRLPRPAAVIVDRHRDEAARMCGLPHRLVDGDKRGMPSPTGQTPA